MLYMLLLYENEELSALRSRQESKALLQEYLALEDELKEKNQYVIGKPLMPTDTASTVKVRGKKVLTIDGPFAEIKEQLGGFYLLDCKDLDEALDYAARIPMSRSGQVEVFVKPTTAKCVIEFFELTSLQYKPTPTWAFYEEYRDIITEMKSKVDSCLAPSNAAFSGFLMMSLENK